MRVFGLLAMLMILSEAILQCDVLCGFCLLHVRKQILTLLSVLD